MAEPLESKEFASFGKFDEFMKVEEEFLALDFHAEWPYEDTTTARLFQKQIGIVSGKWGELSR